ncbi:HU family DNA-binding protein [Lacrimispora amygdalina]|uniref:HU family DNA-binding protein n=1 Tax=Lacrimispora amygdalina TaxID=253257 RepID=A0A3E2NB67_9FIRM|nr:HU family DNA-binding protein [Clostridium indicum]RFZ78233.1 HU family DNA-binding protein [Clostridium indicum]
MTKAELLKEITNSVAELSQKDIDTVLAAYATVVTESLIKNKDEAIPLPGLGTFKVKDVNERRGTIMMGDRKGEEYVTPAHQEPTFKLSKSVKGLFVE